MATNKGLIINKDYIINNKKWWRIKSDEKDIQLIRFLSEYGWFNSSYNRICLKCHSGAILTRKHIVDECPRYANCRKNSIRLLKEKGFIEKVYVSYKNINGNSSRNFYQNFLIIDI